MHSFIHPFIHAFIHPPPVYFNSFFILKQIQGVKTKPFLDDYELKEVMIMVVVVVMTTTLMMMMMMMAVMVMMMMITNQ